ncbi:MAG: cupin domain-containing protein [Sphingopyxis sp.]|nr:cupin domain-containing protein [Sphingopyxis sp.]
MLSGETVLETNGGAQTLGPGMCAGFPAGTGDAHRFLNRTDADVLLLVVGDKSANDEVTYPDIDMQLTNGRGFHRKDGSDFESARSP